MRRLLKRGLGALALSLASTGAWAQGAVVQVGPVTPGETAVFVANGMLAGVNPSGGGGSGTGPITPSQITVSNSGLGICQNSTGGSPSLCSGFINGVPAISTPSSSLIMSIGGVQYALPASFNSGGGSGPVPGAPVVTTSLTVNNANLGATWANGLGTTLSEGFVGGIPTISTPSTSLNISIGGTTYALPAAFGGGGGGGGSGGCASCLPLSGGTLTGLLTASAGVKLPDNQLLTMSTDGTRTLSWQASSNTFTFQNAPVQFNAGAQLTDGQSFIFNATEGTAIALYDTTLNRVRFENVPVQIDNSLYIPGGNIVASGTVAAGDGLLVTGTYTGYTNPGLTFASSTFSGGAPAIILGDNNAISFSTASTGFQLASNTTNPQVWQLTWNGAPIFSVDSNGNLTCAGTGCAATGSQTFSGLTVSPNATVLANASMFNLTLGAGSASSTSITQSGTGNFFINAGGPASIIRFSNSSASPFLDFESTQGDIKTYVPLNISPNVHVVNNGTEFITENVSGLTTGTITNASPVILNLLQVTGDAVTNTGHGLTMLQVSDSVAAGWTGPREAIYGIVNLNALGGDALPGAPVIGITGYGVATVNDGGTALSAGNVGGAVFGGNTVASLSTGATYFSAVTSLEADTVVATGASTLDKEGVLIVLTGGDAVHGTRTDAALVFNEQQMQSTGIGWNTLISIGSPGGYWPVNTSTGTIMAAFANVSGDTTIAAANGIDFHNIAFSGNSWNDGFVTISGTGTLTSTPTAAVTSLVTSKATGAAGTILPFTNPTGLVVGQVATGTNIPANDPIVFVSGGTAVVSVTAPIGVASGATYLALSDTTGLVNDMYVLDATTAVIPANTIINAVSVSSNAPVTLVGATSATGQAVVNVSSGGAGCLAGMLLFDTTNAVVPVNSIVTASSGTTVTLSQNLTGGVVTSDVIKCYPAVALSAATTGAVIVSDAVSFSPMAVLQNPTTGVIAASATITFGATFATVNASISSTSVVNAGAGGIQQQGAPFARAFGNSNNKFSDGYGTVTLLGLGAGTNLSPADYLTTALGWHALHNSTQANSESTAVGWNTQGAITSGGYSTTLGVNTLGSCLICVHDLAIGTDALRNTLTANYDIAIGVTALINDGSNGSNIAIGDSAYPGVSTATGQFNIVIGHSAFSSTSLTTANQNILIGEGAGGSSATSANDDIGIGHLALQSITSTQGVTAIGFQSGNKITGNGNTCFGYQSCYGVTSGQNNTVIGNIQSGNINEITTGIGNIILGYNSTVPSATGNGQISIGNTYYAANGTPTIASGFGGTPSIPHNAGTAAFTVNVGTGGSATSGVIQMTGQVNGYICHATDETHSASFVEDVVVTSNAQVTITNYPRAGGAATPWTASDILEVTCSGF